MCFLYKNRTNYPNLLYVVDMKKFTLIEREKISIQYKTSNIYSRLQKR